MISEKSIEEVIERTQIQDVLEDFVDLRNSGSSLKGLCPFHDEKTPSFMVSPAKNIYKCFGCGEGGDSISFLINHEKLSYPEAIRYLADKYQIELEETKLSYENQLDKQVKDSLYIINDFANKQFEHNLNETNEGKSIGLSYLKSRKLEEKTIAKWSIGYANGDREQLHKELLHKKYNLELAEQLGLIKGDRDFFNSRITFPIRNLSGKIIGFGARTLSSNKKVPKYLNSPESEIYNKSKSLYGIYHAKNDIRKKSNCYLVEGYTDVIRMSEGGIENVVASSGTSLTEGQVRIIKRFSSQITMIYDGDTAGVKAALRGLDLVLAQDMDVKLVLLPEGEDPDSYCQKLGGEAFEGYLKENAKDFILFKADLLLEETENDPVKRSHVVKDIVESIAHIPDPLKRNIYVKATAKLLELNEEVIQQEANRVIQKLLSKQKKAPTRNTPNEPPPWITEETEVTPEGAKIVRKKATHDPQEQDLIRILFNYGDKIVTEESKVTIAKYIYDNIQPYIEYFDNETYRKIIEDIPSALAEKELIDLKHWLHHRNESIKQLAIHLTTDRYIYADWKSRGIELQTQSPPDENFVKDSVNSVLRIRYRKLKRLVKEMEVQIVEVEKNNPEDLKYHLDAYGMIKQDIMKIGTLLGSVI